MGRTVVRGSCGHEHTYTLTGPRADRERTAAWLAGRPCPACERTAEAAARGVRIVEAVAATGQDWPALGGDERDVARARRVREQMLTDFRGYLADRMAPANRQGERDPGAAELADLVYRIYAGVALRETSASRWLADRDDELGWRKRLVAGRTEQERDAIAAIQVRYESRREEAAR